VLAAEDEESDRLILQHVFKRAGVTCPIILVRDGSEVVDYLSGHEPYADRAVHPLPRLLLLDLKMPRMSGFDVLAWLETRPEFHGIPAVVLSSSCDESDISTARDMGARDFLSKPHDLHDFIKIIEVLNSKWLGKAGG
jgi:CheY-like chemotaxis protein